MNTPTVVRIPEEPPNWDEMEADFRRAARVERGWSDTSLVAWYRLPDSNGGDGFLGYREKDGGAIVAYVYVRPAMRLHGVARAMLLALNEELPVAEVIRPVTAGGRRLAEWWDSGKKPSAVERIKPEGVERIKPTEVVRQSPGRGVRR